LNSTVSRQARTLTYIEGGNMKMMAMWSGGLDMNSEKIGQE